MHFPKFWTLAKRDGVSAWGWSDLSLADALADGLKRVDRSIAWLQTDLEAERGPYGYPNRPMREEVVREFRDASGQLTAVVSRNSYGCLVLNTARALFVDVDEPSPGLFGALASLFGGGGFERKLVVQVKQWTEAKADWGWRVYRTRAGIRLLATHQPIGPEEAVCQEAFNTFRADRLYQKLCGNQKCFRARITPKPWRCGMKKPDMRWPWVDAEAEQRFRVWDGKYTAASARHAVCRLLGQVGRSEIHPELRELTVFHDAATRIDAELPLA